MRRDEKRKIWRDTSTNIKEHIGGVWSRRTPWRAGTRLCMTL